MTLSNRGDFLSDLTRLPNCLLGLTFFLATCGRLPTQEPKTTQMRQLTDMPGHERRVRYSPDGSQIAFTNELAGQTHIYLLPRTGGEPTRLMAWSYQDGEPAWSPDVRRLAFKTSKDDWQGIWILDLAGGDPVKITPEGMQANSPDWSPDGTNLAFHSNQAGSWDIWIMKADGGEPRRVTSHPDNEWIARWAPDNKHLVFYTTWGKAMTDIRAVDIETGEVQTITDHPAEDYRPAWSPQGDWIAFPSRRGGSSDLWLVTPDGGTSVQLTDDNLHRDDPSWAHDGWLAYAQYDGRDFLYRVSVADGIIERVGDGDQNRLDPVVAPDGATIAFIARGKAENQVWLAEPSGGQARVLRRNDHFQSSVAWSPDGSRLAFVEHLGGGPRTGNIWTVNRDGSNPRQVTAFGHVHGVVWAGEETLVYSFDEQANYRREIWSMPVAGGDPQPLVTGDGDHLVTASSPDGKRIAFTKNQSGRKSVFLLDLGGRDPALLPGQPESSEGARWSPDGRYIALLANADGQSDLYVLPGEGGEARRVTSDPERESWPSWTLSGKHLVYSREMGGYNIWEMDPAPILAREGH